jgi:hypothetical protein
MSFLSVWARQTFHAGLADVAVVLASARSTLVAAGGWYHGGHRSWNEAAQGQDCSSLPSPPCIYTTQEKKLVKFVQPNKKNKLW